MISPATRSDNGLQSHRVESANQSGKTAIHVLLPDDCNQSADNRLLYVLPVEPIDGDYCGDALAEVRRLDLHNRYGLICVKPTFSHPPWYADHPTDRAIQQETYFLREIVPFVDENYAPSTEPPLRLLLGFSKSGWGALSLLLRHPDLFARAAAFDAPLAWQSPDRYGMAEIFDTQSNFDDYCVVDLIKRTAAQLGSEPRIAISGFSDFRGHHQFLHFQMQKLGIPHEYEDGPCRAHRWDSGWLADAVAFLVGNSRQILGPQK
jgi:hypothetical protein